MIYNKGYKENSPYVSVNTLIKPKKHRGINVFSSGVAEEQKEQVLEISRSNDPAELEADRIAEEVAGTYSNQGSSGSTLQAKLNPHVKQQENRNNLILRKEDKTKHKNDITSWQWNISDNASVLLNAILGKGFKKNSQLNMEQRDSLAKAADNSLLSKAQASLFMAGYDLGKSGKNKNGIDGDPGPKTTSAIKEFQKAGGLGAIGELNLQTLMALDMITLVGIKKDQLKGLAKDALNDLIIENKDYDMTDTTTWNAITPRFQSNTKHRFADTYSELINQFEVESNPRYTPRDGHTFCNIFAWDVSIAMNVELPRFVEVNKVGDHEEATGKALGRNAAGHKVYTSDATATELNANRLAIWLKAQGFNYGWKSVTPETAQERANQGYMTIGVIDESPNIGHVHIVRPAPDGKKYNPAKGVYIAQAGGSSAISNGLYFLDKYSKTKYGQYCFYSHD